MPGGIATIPEQRAGTYLAFRLGHEEFAIEAHRVRQIMGVRDFAAVPHTPPCVKNAINLRGTVIPVVDLRLRFGLPKQDYAPGTCMIVVEVEQEGAWTLSGVVVDEVSDVLSLEAGNIEDMPDCGRGATKPYLLGIAKRKGNETILLDINVVLSKLELREAADECG